MSLAPTALITRLDRNRSLLTAHLEEALEMDICPICHLAGVAEHRYLDLFLYERINDLRARAELAASHGFCAYHTYRLLDVGGFGCHAKIAIIYQDVVGALVREVDGPPPRRGQAAATPPCAVCRTMAETTDRYLAVLVDELRHATFREKVAGSAGLCMAHYRQALSLSHRSARDWLQEEQTRRLESLSFHLGEFVRKSVAQNEPFGPERDVWLRVIRTCAGGLWSGQVREG